jgi:hypothetical protein
MNFAIRYLTEYDYDAEVLDNLNALRVKPATGSRQRCDEFSVRLTPEVRLHRHTDYFGTEVVEFEISRPHRHLTVDVRARVSTQPYAQAPPSSWEALDDPAYREAGGEFLLQTDDAPSDPVLAELISETGHGGSPMETVLLVSRLIPDRFEYRRGATFVDSSIADLLQAGAGVCQDFVHLGLCLLRHHGIAARYVSGYLFAGGSDDLRGRHARVAGGAAAGRIGGVRCGSDLGRGRPDQPRAGRRASRQGRTRPPLRGRAADQGRVPRPGLGDARGVGDDDAAGTHRPGVDRPLLTVLRQRPGGLDLPVLRAPAGRACDQTRQIGRFDRLPTPDLSQTYST